MKPRHLTPILALILAPACVPYRVSVPVDVIEAGQRSYTVVCNATACTANDSLFSVRIPTGRWLVDSVFSGRGLKSELCDPYVLTESRWKPGVPTGGTIVFYQPVRLSYTVEGVRDDARTCMRITAYQTRLSPASQPVDDATRLLQGVVDSLSSSLERAFVEPFQVEGRTFYRVRYAYKFNAKESQQRDAIVLHVSDRYLFVLYFAYRNLVTSQAGRGLMGSLRYWDQ